MDKTKRGKGTKCMVVDGQGVILGIYLDVASPAEVALLEPTLATIAVPRAGPGHPRHIQLAGLPHLHHPHTPLHTTLDASIFDVGRLTFDF